MYLFIFLILKDLVGKTETKSVQSYGDTGFSLTFSNGQVLHISHRLNNLIYNKAWQTLQDKNLMEMTR